MFVIEFQVWIRKIQPVYNGSYSYAVAISSKHESNPPSEISVNLTKLELKHPNGYLVVVSLMKFLKKNF